MAFHQNNHSTHHFHSEASGSPFKVTDDDTIRRIQKDNFDLRRQVDEKNRAIYVLTQNYSKQQHDLDDTKARFLALEKKSTDQEAELDKTKRLFVNACKQRDPHALNNKVVEINGQLQTAERELKSEKNEVKRLKRKLSDEQAEYEKNIKTKRVKLAEKCSEIFQITNELKNEREKCTSQASELASMNEKLKTTTERVAELEGNRDTHIILMKKQNECIRELRSQASLLQPALEENQRLQQSLEEAQKTTQDLEQTIEKCKSTAKKLRSRSYRLSTKLKQKQAELDDKSNERSHLFKFTQDVGILIQLPLNNSSPLQTQLPELLVHLKETLQVGGCIVQYQQHKQHPSTPQHTSVSPATCSPPPPQQPSEKKDEDDQLYDEFTSQSMMNIQFPLPSPQHQPSTSNINSTTVQAVSTMPQQSNTAAETETTENAGNNPDSLFAELMSMCNVNQSVTQKLKTKVNKAKKGLPRATRSVIITQTKKHEEDVKRRGENCGGGGAKYFCKCGTMETSLDRLNIHIQQGNPDRKFACKKCPRMFKRLCDLRRHMTRIHFLPRDLDDIVSGCRLCGEMFTHRDHLRQHKLSVQCNSTTTTKPDAANENEVNSTSVAILHAESGNKERTTVPTSTISAAPEEVVPPPPQPNNMFRRVPSIIFIDLENEEVDVET